MARCRACGRTIDGAGAGFGSHYRSAHSELYRLSRPARERALAARREGAVIGPLDRFTGRSG